MDCMFRSLLLSTLIITMSTQATAAYNDICLENGVAFSISLGPSWTSAGTTQTLALQPDIQKSYVADNFTRGMFNGELFLGYQFYMVPAIFAQLGFSYALTSDVNLSGSVWEDADPDFNNFKYQYKTFLNNFAVKGKLLFEFSPTWYPFVGGSIGVRGYNRAYNYSETPYIVEEVAPPPFANGTESNVTTYSAEAGLQKVINKNIYVGIGYNYNNWGKVSLGTAAGQTTSSKLTIGNFITSGVRFNVTFISSDLF